MAYQPSYRMHGQTVMRWYVLGEQYDSQEHTPALASALAFATYGAILVGGAIERDGCIHAQVLGSTEAEGTPHARAQGAHLH